MLEITPLTNRPGNVTNQAYRTAVAAERAKPSLDVDQVPSSDRLELSAAASDPGPESRAAHELDERIRALREDIANDTYLTPEKID